MRPWKRILLLIIVLLTILSLLLAACGPLDNSAGSSDNGKDKDRDKDHGNGKDKEKDTSKDKDPDKGGKANKLLICHKTGSAKNPYVQIRVANDSRKDGHGAHAGDLIPAPVNGCP